ncbi:hypothetical protein [Falsiroseomonas tokyonensis]|uniref:Uncharacterized protein n=1 Tax=Falsiroseomonas tokyonensis TaxID=430521 RepID=A0ABV7C4X2_9PROT|nr:hypothetical protein [Falsiroseomonas tokyonensis]MBU8541676.1 hypothetical protein [Falsiroseomonas tokyonensis]
MQATSVRIYRTLVPGLTNVTNRLRYYSFYCWTVATFNREVHNNDTAHWRRFIRRAEALLALASYRHDRDRSGGMAGREWAERLDRERLLDGISVLDLSIQDAAATRARSLDSYLGAIGGNFGQFYIASMLEVGLLSPSKGVPLIADGPGRAMAAAYRQAVGPMGDVALKAILTGEVAVADLEAIGEAMGPHCIQLPSEEMNLLRGFIRGDGGRPGVGGARRSSAWLLLHYMRRLREVGGDPKKHKDDHVREAFYNGLMPGKEPFEAPGETVKVWRAYQANELCHAALAAIFNVMLNHAERADGPAPDVLCAEVSGRLAEAAGATTSWADWAEACGERFTQKEAELEDAARRCLVKLPEQEGLPEGAVEALQLLGTLWARWAARQDGVLAVVDRHAGGGARSLSAVLRTLNDHRDQPLAEALASVMRLHLIRQHLEIAGHKLLANSLDTFHFTLEDGRVCESYTRAFFNTAPRLTNLSRFLEDARYHEGNQLTADGHAFLDSHAPD